MDSRTHAAAGRQRLHVIIACMIAQNLSLGIAFGSFGALLMANEAHFVVNRAEMSFGMSALTTALGLSCAFGGGLVGRMPARSMILGAMLSIGGYSGLVFVQSYWLSLMLFSLIGIGCSLLAVLSPVTLIMRWVADGRGKVLGIINLPIALFVTPFVVAKLLPIVGREPIYAGIAALFVLLIPILLMVRDNPESTAEGHSQAPPAHLPLAHFFSRADFWLLALGIGILAGIGTAFTVHAVPFGQSRGLEPASAAAIMSIYAAVGLGGTLLFGWLADRLGPPAALMTAALVQALMLSGLVVAPLVAFPVLAGILGMASTPLVTLHGAALGALFGIHGVSKAMGYSYAIKLPFIFAVAPLVGWAFDEQGQYGMAFLGCSLALVIAAALFFVASRWTAGRRRRETVTSVAAA